MDTYSWHCRAEDWNLATPLQTCSLLVERRGDTLTFSFLAAPDNNLFAQAIIDITTGQMMKHCLEQVVDSSRYFVLKIQSSTGREATIGFGFRDREEATDLRECLQHYEKSIRREKQASTGETESYHVPVLKQGEKIHVDRNSGKTTITKVPGGAGQSAVPLLKKPPPAPASGGEVATVSTKETEPVTSDMGEVNLNCDG